MTGIGANCPWRNPCILIEYLSCEETPLEIAMGRCIRAKLLVVEPHDCWSRIFSHIGYCLILRAMLFLFWSNHAVFWDHVWSAFLY